MEIHPFKDILQVEGLDDKGNQETGGGDRERMGASFNHHNYRTRHVSHLWRGICMSDFQGSV